MLSYSKKLRLFSLSVFFTGVMLAEVPDGSGLLHRQGAADHGKDLPEGPGGGDCGKTSQVHSANMLLCCLFSPALSFGEKTLIITVSCSIAERPPKHTDTVTQGLLADVISFFFRFTRLML